MRRFSLPEICAAFEAFFGSAKVCLIGTSLILFFGRLGFLFGDGTPSGPIGPIDGPFP
jgi:hypothetical protein